MLNRGLLLPAPAGDLMVVDTFGCYAHLWWLITFTKLIKLNLACNPFRKNGCMWAVALKAEVSKKSVPAALENQRDA